MSETVKDLDRGRSGRSTRESRLSSSSSKGHGSSSGGGSTTSAVTSSSTALTPVEEMYRIYEKINAAEDKSGMEKDYAVFIASVSKSENEKKLASQFIPRFLDAFPGMGQEAFDALLDLCEDNDILIRRQVVKDVVTACQKVPKFVPKMADVLGQLLETADANELAGIERSLTSLFHIDGLGALIGVFNQISHGDELARTRCLKFVGARVKDMGPEIINPTFENSLFEEARRILYTADPSTFKSVVSILLGTKYLQQLNGQQALIDTLVEACTTHRLFVAIDEEKMKRLIAITNYALGLFSSQISSTPFVSFYCTKILNMQPQIVAMTDGEAIRMELVRQMANCASLMTRIEDADANDCLNALYDNLKILLPLPPESGEPNVGIDFGLTECLMYTFHKLSVFNPKFLLQDPAMLPDFRRRLQYFARGSQALMKKLREDLGDKRGENLKTEENRCKMTANMNSMIRDMFHNPPSFKSSITPSWKPMAKVNINKRAKPGPLGATPTKIPKVDRERPLYQPPSGKFSQRGGRFGLPNTAARGGSAGGGPRNGAPRNYKGGLYRPLFKR